MKLAVSPLLAALSLSLVACAEESPPMDDSGLQGGAARPTVVQVTATYDAASNQHLFRTDMDTVPAGWTTFQFTNASPMLHFVFLDHLPGARTSEHLLSEVSPAFQRSSDLIREGKADEALVPFESLPEWFGELVFRGGPGFTSPGRTTEATLYLEPGNYVLECYIKTADGVFHWGLGMYKDLHVTEEVSPAEPPTGPTIQITTTDSALVVAGEPVAGPNLVAVRFEQERELIGRDVHVARLDADSNVEAIIAWMDFNQPEGLVSTAEDPAPATFLGGVHDMPAGNTAYFTVDLEPGEYLWISEYSMSEPSYQRFTVPRGGN